MFAIAAVCAWKMENTFVKMNYKKPLWAVRQVTRETGLVEDVCEHGVGHPNVAFLRANKDFVGVHGCCGCCRQKEPTKRQIKRWSQYQADNPRQGYNLTVDKLNELQAKNELCDAMDLIAKMMHHGRMIEIVAQDAHYAPK